MSNKVKWFSEDLQIELTGTVVAATSRTLHILLEDGNVIQKKPRQVEYV